MAKLSARGRKELARVVREKVQPDLEKCSTCQGSGQYTSSDPKMAGMFPELPVGVCFSCKGAGQKPPSTVWERTTKTLMSDGKILEKWDVRFRPHMSYDPPEGNFHSYGWKVYGKAKAGLTAERFIEVYVKAGYRSE